MKYFFALLITLFFVSPVLADSRDRALFAVEINKYCKGDLQVLRRGSRLLLICPVSERVFAVAEGADLAAQGRSFISSYLRFYLEKRLASLRELACSRGSAECFYLDDEELDWRIGFLNLTFIQLNRELDGSVFSLKKALADYGLEASKDLIKKWNLQAHNCERQRREAVVKKKLLKQVAFLVRS